MIRSSLLLSLTMLVLPAAWADDPLLPPAHIPEGRIVHLLPREHPADTRAWEALVEKKLYVTPGDFGRILTCAALYPESCLSIYPRGEGEKRKFFLTSTQAVDIIYNPETGPPKGEEAKDPEVTRIDREISAELAHAIQNVWKKALLGVRPQEKKPATGLDGATWFLSAEIEGKGKVEGIIYSPEAGMAEDLIQLADALTAFTAKEDSSEKQMLEKVQAFEKTMP